MKLFSRLLELAELETTSNFSQTNESHEHYVDPTKELVRSIQALKEGPSSKLTNKSIPEFKKSNTKSVFSKRNARIDVRAMHKT